MRAGVAWSLSPFACQVGYVSLTVMLRWAHKEGAGSAAVRDLNDAGVRAEVYRKRAQRKNQRSDKVLT